MKIGVCSGIENIEKAANIGFDYIEPSVVSIAGMSEEQFCKVLEMVKASRIRCEAFNVLFPGDIKIVGPEVDYDKIKAYLENAFKRISQLGAKVVVIGSGGARRCPEMWDMNTAWEQIVKVVAIAGEEASKYDITITIEPLNKAETNTINSVPEGEKLVLETGNPNVKLLADFYHMRRETEDMDVLVKAGTVLRHLHIANSDGRVYPKAAEEDQYQQFFKAIRQVGYAGRLSIEGGTENFEEDAPIALKLLRELAE